MKIRETARLAAPKLKCLDCKHIILWMLSGCGPENNEDRVSGRCRAGVADNIYMAGLPITDCTEFKRLR